MRKLHKFRLITFIAPLFIFISSCLLASELIGGAVAKPAQSALASIHWQPYQTGLADARKFKKPVFIDFYTDWCHWCHELDRTTYQDRRVIELLNGKFISIKVNAESKEGIGIAGRYPIRGYPSLWFLKSTGEVITPVNGYIAADQMVPLLSYVGNGYYATMTFDEFMQNTFPKLKK